MPSNTKAKLNRSKSKSWATGRFKTYQLLIVGVTAAGLIGFAGTRYSGLSLASGTPLCVSGGTAFCLSDLGLTAPNNPVVARSRIPGPNQDITLIRVTGACGGAGKVTSTCPFVLGSGLNTRFETKYIYHLKFADTSNTCAVAPNRNGVLTGACNATGVDWVSVPSGSVEEWVNVYSTNTSSSVASKTVPYYLDPVLQGGRGAIIRTASQQAPSEWGF
jgi:hypothetical protein